MAGMRDLGVWSNRGYLPHYQDGASLQAITYRLGDALPSTVLSKIEEQALSDLAKRLSLENHLDQGLGSCLLNEPANATTVLENWKHFHGRRYLLHAWVIMPNHVHVLIEQLGTHSLGEIVHSWKSYTAKRLLERHEGELGRGVGGGGPRAVAVGRSVWQRDYFDRYIRNEAHYHACVEYLHMNPVKAGLVRSPELWPWSSAAKSVA